MKFKFRRNANIGNPEAELDGQFLYECYVDNGNLEVIMDTSNPKMFVLGRTGTGKSAILLKIKNEKPNQTIVVTPETLALKHISNSTVIRFFEDLGVKLEPFYKLLWNHVFAVELIKAKYHVNTEESKRSFFQRILPLKKDKKKERAIAYLEKWGETFWEETEYRIKEITEKIEQELKGAIEPTIKDVKLLSIKGGLNLTKEQKSEVIERGKKVVNEIQMRELNEVIDLISNDLLTDNQKPFYVVIDKLDEDWVEEKLRYKLIKALLIAAKDFSKVANAKIIIALRQDLMERVFRLTRGAGHQEEKYDALCINIRWKEDELIEILDRRIDMLVREHYTKHTVRLFRLLPNAIDKKDPIKYILDRTFMRPRDAILFLNRCIELCIDKPKITAKIIKEAEKEYSKKRFRSVADEWQDDYPSLLDFSKLLKRKASRFSLCEIKEQEIGEIVLEILIKDKTTKGELWHMANRYFEGRTSHINLRNELFSIFYKVGFLGVKFDPSEETKWSFKNEVYINPSELSDNVKIYIHKAFWSILDIKFRV